MSLIKLAKLLIIISLFAPPLHGYDSSESPLLEGVLFDFYVDEGGQALVVGYLEPEMLNKTNFLEFGDYIYDENLKEFYAITNSLTSTKGDLWELKIVLEDHWSEYLAVIYLPINAEIDIIDMSDEQDYSVFESDDSLVVEIWGYEVDNPSILIEYYL